jgi:ketosteroid isomerase-like protein
MSTTETTEQTTAETEIRELIADREAAMQARDAARFVAHYAPEIVKFDLAPPLRNAGPQLLDPAGMAAWLSSFADDDTFEFAVTDLDVTTDGSLAFASSLNRLAATPRGATQSFELWYRSTLCLRNTEGTWRVVHEHSSTPFYMDGTLRAATDLKP